MKKKLVRLITIKAGIREILTDDDILAVPVIRLELSVGSDFAGVTQELNPAMKDYAMSDEVFLKRFSDFYCERALKGLKATFKYDKLNMSYAAKCLKKEMPLLIQKSLNFETYIKNINKK